jgi:hypothetical protein
MVDSMIVESIKISLGQIIIFWDNDDRRYEGKILGCSDDYLKFLDSHKNSIRFIKISQIKEAELR